MLSAWTAVEGAAGGSTFTFNLASVIRNRRTNLSSSLQSLGVLRTVRLMFRAVRSTAWNMVRISYDLYVVTAVGIPRATPCCFSGVNRAGRGLRDTRAMAPMKVHQKLSSVSQCKTQVESIKLCGGGFISMPHTRPWNVHPDHLVGRL